MERDFKGVWIPKEIWLDKRLSVLDKIILIEIDSLATDKGCFASNEYLADFCQCSISKIKNAISKLKEYGYLYVISFDGRTRYLGSTMSNNISQPKKEPLADKKNTADSQKVATNNIDNNIESNNISTSKQKIACESPKETKKKRELSALQEFSNQVIAKFESLEEHQKGIWFRRNCRCLSDILKFCGGTKESIPMALECINICCDLMEKKGYNGAGYEAVCRNLPYYYEEAKKKFRR